MEKIDNVNYDDYKYKSYIWKEDGRHKKPEKRKKTKELSNLISLRLKPNRFNNLI